MSAPNKNKFFVVSTLIKPIATQSHINTLFSKPKKQKTNEENETNQLQLQRSCSTEEKDQKNATIDGSRFKEIKTDSEKNSASIDSTLLNQTNQSLQIENHRPNHHQLDLKDHGQGTKTDDQDKITKASNEQEVSTEVAENQNDEEENSKEEDDEDEMGEDLVDIMNEDDSDDRTSWAKGTPNH